MVSLLGAVWKGGRSGGAGGCVTRPAHESGEESNPCGGRNPKGCVAEACAGTRPYVLSRGFTLVQLGVAHTSVIVCQAHLDMLPLQACDERHRWTMFTDTSAFAHFVLQTVFSGPSLGACQSQLRQCHATQTVVLCSAHGFEVSCVQGSALGNQLQKPDGRCQHHRDNTQHSSEVICE